MNKLPDNPGIYQVSLVLINGEQKRFALYAENPLAAEEKARQYASEKPWPAIADIAATYKDYGG